MTSRPALEVVRCGLPVLVEDGGRPGLAAIGVGRSGAADRSAWALGQRLLANTDDAAALEITYGTAEFAAHGALTVTLTVTLTGAPVPATVSGRPVPMATVVSLRDGDRLVLGPPETGLRTYLSVRGGIAVDAVLGSSSTDVLSGIGPAPLTAGDAVPVGTPPTGAFPVVDAAAPRRVPSPVRLRTTPGPRADWFADAATLTTATWTVSPDSNWVAVRLDGPALERAQEYAGRELPSEGLVPGAVQVPADGRPLVFLADHPVIGGYPVIAVVRHTDLDLAAQARPGDPLTFTT